MIETEQPSANTEEFWELFDRYRHAPTAQLTAVGNTLIAAIDRHVHVLAMAAEVEARFADEWRKRALKAESLVDELRTAYFEAKAEAKRWRQESMSKEK